MITTTTASIEGRRILSYLGVVAGEAVVNTNFIKDFFNRALGERTDTPEAKLNAARETALRLLQERAAALGADAVVDLRLRYTAATELMLIASATGTAVKLEG